MDPTATTAPAEPPPPDVPLLFACAIWVPTFAVVLWFMFRLFNRQPLLFDRPEAEPEGDDGDDPDPEPPRDA